MNIEIFMVSTLGLLLSYFMIRIIMSIIETISINGTFTIKSNSFLVFVSGIFLLIQIQIFIIFIILYGHDILFTSLTSSIFFFNLDTSLLFIQLLMVIRFNVKNSNKITTFTHGKQKHLNYYLQGIIFTYLLIIQFKEFTFPMIYFSYMIDILFSLYITYIQIIIEQIKKYNEIELENHYHKQLYLFQNISVIVLIIKIDNIFYSIYQNNEIIKHILYIMTLILSIYFYKFYEEIKIHFKKQQNYL